VESARAAGHSFDLLSKPVHPKDLIATIVEMMEGGNRD
jgi:hypothetical protein